MKRLLIYSLLPLFASALVAKADHVLPELKNGVLTVKAGSYQATFSYGHRWNLSSFSYDGIAVIAPGGANQFNLNAKTEGGATEWHGGIASPEEVESVTFYSDETPHVLEPQSAGQNQTFPAAGSYSMEKTTKVGPYQLTLRTTVSEEGITEKLAISAIAPTDRVGFLYNSRFSFTDAFTGWFAVLADGFEEEGDFGKDGQTVLNQFTSGLAIYQPEHQLAALIRTTEEPPIATHFFWNNGQRRQFHSRMSPISDTDGSVTITRQLSVWSTGDESGDWQEQARKRLDANR